MTQRLLLIGLLGLATCTTDSGTKSNRGPGGSGGPSKSTTTQASAAAGVTATSEDGVFEVRIGAGALSEDAVITINQGVTQAHSATIGKTYEVLVNPAAAAQGLGFAASVSFKVTAAQLPDGGEYDLGVGTGTAPGSAIASVYYGAYTDETYTVSVTHFSYFALLDAEAYADCTCDKLATCDSQCACDIDCRVPSLNYAACNGDGDCDGGNCEDGYCLDECLESAECDADFSCIGAESYVYYEYEYTYEGTCLKGCSTDSECGGSDCCFVDVCIPAPFCENVAASPNYPSCRTDENCTSGKCEAAYCISLCESAEACGGNFTCGDGHCLTTCTNDANCGGSDCCYDGACLPSGLCAQIGDECEDASDCEEGEECDFGYCEYDYGYYYEEYE